MNLQPRTDSITVQKEFLATTQGVVNKVGGVTLKGSAFTPDASGYVKAGSGIRLNSADGLCYPHDAGVTAGTVFVLAHDVKVIAGQNPIAGALEEAYLKKSVVQTVETGRVVISDALIAHAVNGGRFKLR